MNKKIIITYLLALVAMTGQAQEERIDTVIPKFLSNGYFFREMPQLPDGEITMSRLKDKEGNSVTVINVNATLPKSLIRKAIPREQVHNADQFLNGLNMMATVTSLTIVVDKKGIVRHAVHGTNETKREELLAKIKKAEAE